MTDTTVELPIISKSPASEQSMRSPARVRSATEGDDSKSTSHDMSMARDSTYERKLYRSMSCVERTRVVDVDSDDERPKLYRSLSSLRYNHVAEEAHEAQAGSSPVLSPQDLLLKVYGKESPLLSDVGILSIGYRAKEENQISSSRRLQRTRQTMARLKPIPPGKLIPALSPT